MESLGLFSAVGAPSVFLLPLAMEMNIVIMTTDGVELVITLGPVFR